ncbi:MAG: OmpA family protein [Myxococcales bacterium]|nr:OmpA family protein [Myxococcales bacterium]
MKHLRRLPLLVLAAACGPAAHAPPPPSAPLALEPTEPTEPTEPAEPDEPDEPDEPEPRPPTQPPVPTEPATAAIADGAIVLSQPILFLAGGAELADASASPLTALAELLAAKPDLTLVRIEGHTDAMGMGEANQRLSEARALATARALVARGVACARLLPVGFGENKPVADNRTAEGRAANRRMVIAPAALRGRAIGGMPVDGGGQVAGDPCQ